MSKPAPQTVPPGRRPPLMIRTRLWLAPRWLIKQSGQRPVWFLIGLVVIACTVMTVGILLSAPR